VVDKHRIIAQWNRLVAQCTAAGKAGLRAFCMMDCFTDNGFTEEVVDYEQALPAKFAMPFVPVCAYMRRDIESMTEDQRRRLVLCHSHVWTPQ
jgi:non-ribosomal peptide synthetase component F